MQHQLTKTKTGYHCEICKLNWKRKPSGECVGIPAISWDEKPKSCRWKQELPWFNLRLKTNAQPVAYKHNSKNTHSYCYRLEDCEKIREDVPDLIISKQEKDRLGYLTKRQLEKQHLKPRPKARSCAVSYEDKEFGGIGFCVFYHPEDTVFYARDSYICKSTLKKTYLLSDKWVKRVGEPDEISEHEKYGTNIYLYSRKRVEKFLADNAEEYGEWLDERDKYVVRALPLIESTKLKSDQRKKCLTCASSCMLDDGLFCVIHPNGLEKHQIPCQDWSGLPGTVNS